MACGNNEYGQFGFGHKNKQNYFSAVWTIPKLKDVDALTIHDIEIDGDKKFIMYPIVNPIDDTVSLSVSD